MSLSFVGTFIFFAVILIYCHNVILSNAFTLNNNQETVHSISNKNTEDEKQLNNFSNSENLKKTKKSVFYSDNLKFNFLSFMYNKSSLLKEAHPLNKTMQNLIVSEHNRYRKMVCLSLA